MNTNHRPHRPANRIRVGADPAPPNLELAAEVDSTTRERTLQQLAEALSEVSGSADAQYGARVSPDDFAVKRLLDRKLATIRGDGMVMFDHPGCKAIHDAILGDPARGLLYRLLHRLAMASDAPGKMVDPDGINGELGITTRCFAPYHALIKLGLVSKHPAWQLTSSR